MNLAKTSISKIPASPGLVMPVDNVFELPEKVLQFGTGVLLRGLPDFIINSANNKGCFNGRIVMVKSTSNGSADVFEKQDGLYTVCVRGIDEGKKVSENHLIASVSRVLAASEDWDKILECAANPDMQIIISNTTEVGITLVKDNIHADPPKSFPGKLLSFLYHRFKYFKGDSTKGMVIIPTELIPNNGDKLLSIVLELAHISGLEIAFLDWLENENHFCNSLVDRIVPGALSAEEQKKVEQALGYDDELMIMSEVYSLWAIQSANENVKNILSFACKGSGVIIEPNIDKFRKLKLRLLNGSHTFCCALAFLSGFDTVKDAMENELFSDFLQQLMFDEIIPILVNDGIAKEEAADFANKVQDRYRNSFVDHHWLSISAQYSLKMNLRNTYLIEGYGKLFGEAALHMEIGMAAFILFMKAEKDVDGKYYGERNNKKYVVNDENAAYFSEIWEEKERSIMINKILSNHTLWEADLTLINGFEKAVLYWLNFMLQNNVYAVLEAVKTKSNCIE